MKSDKIYEVILQDEWNNLLLIGFYADLDDCIDDINQHIEPVYNVRLSKGDIRERAGTLSMVFDTDLGDIFDKNEDLCGVMVRGFILHKQEIINDMKNIKKRGD